MVLLVLKATDYRMDLSQICSCQAMKKFIDGLNPQNIFIMYTHCDSAKVELNTEFVNKKIKALKTYAKLSIPEENVVKFNKTKQSLEHFVENFIKGEAHIIENIEEGLEEFDDGLETMAKRIDE